MLRDAKFWIALALFQVLFGLIVFAVTRDYYTSGVDGVSAGARATGNSLPAWPEPGSSPFGPPTQGDVTLEDPVETSRRADDFFVNKQYEAAADLYGRMLALDPGNVDIYNNLGITLHYLGRSNEALGKLNEGVAVDPTHQRIWLTLGFVNSQLGNVEQARAALTKASQMGPDNEIGQAASGMLEDLP
jgi:tetratricopeptide (TPR) repeat protein